MIASSVCQEHPAGETAWWGILRPHHSLNALDAEAKQRVDVGGLMVPPNEMNILRVLNLHTEDNSSKISLAAIKGTGTATWTANLAKRTVERSNVKRQNRLFAPP